MSEYISWHLENGSHTGDLVVVIIWGKGNLSLPLAVPASFPSFPPAPAAWTIHRQKRRLNGVCKIPQLWEFRGEETKLACSSSVFLRLKKKKLSTTTSTFQPWKVSNKHGLRMFFIIFSSLLWMTVIACPKKVRKQRNVRGSLFLSVAVSPALALDLLWCQCKCKCHYNVSVRFLPLLLSVSIRCLMLP